MVRKIKIVKQTEKNIGEIFKNGIAEDELLFRELQRDTIGRSGANSMWGNVHINEDGKIKNMGIALHKDYDYDYPKAAYSEKVWSIMGNGLIGDCVRIPYIDIVEKDRGCPEIISYRLMNNDKEDMIHIKDTLFHKYERDEIKERRDIYTIEELLECIKIQINNEENYKGVEKSVIFSIILDAVTNNGDRHPLNWSLVRNKEKGKYSLAVFDHASAFINMFEDKEYFLRNGWNSTYISVGDNKVNNKIGSSGQKVIEYISKKYSEYFEEWLERFEERMPGILKKIKQEKLNIDYRRFEKKIEEKRRYVNRLIDRGEIEYE